MDSNFIANPQQNALNPLQTLGQAVGVKNALLANQEKTLDIQANQAVGDAIQQSTDPTTGQIDYAKLHSLVANNPRAAYNLNQATGQMQSNQNANLGGQQQQLEMTQNRLGVIGQRLSGLATDPNTTRDDVISSMGQMVKDGLITPDRAFQEVSNIPQDQSKIHDYLFSHAEQLATANQQLSMAEGNWQMVNVGGHQIAIQRNPQTQQGAGVAAVFNNELSPSELAQQVQVTTPNGQPGMTNVGTLLKQEGAPAGGQSQLIEGGIPGIDQNTQQPGTPPGVAVTGPAATQLQLYQQANDRQSQRLQEANAAPDQVYGLNKAAESLNGAIAGPKSAELTNLLGTLNTLGFKVAPGTAENSQLLSKYMSNSIDTAARDAGFNGSNARLEAWSSGQPDPNKLNAPAMKQAIGYVRSQIVGKAQFAQFVQQQQQQNGSNTAAAAEQAWRQAYDPNVMFIASLNNPQQAAKYVQKLNPEERNLFATHYAEMQKLGAFNNLSRFGNFDAGEPGQ